MPDQAHTSSCQSCSMTIESGDYCTYCTNEEGGLLGFDETFERFIQFAMGRDTNLDRATAEANTRAFMGQMPAWKGHPSLAQSS